MNELENFINSFALAVNTIGRGFGTTLKYLVDIETAGKINRIQDDEFMSDKVKNIAIQAYVIDYRLIAKETTDDSSQN